MISIHAAFGHAIEAFDGRICIVSYADVNAAFPGLVSRKIVDTLTVWSIIFTYSFHNGRNKIIQAD